jgi:hypothetical protein
MSTCKAHGVTSCPMCLQAELERVAMRTSIRAMMDAIPGGTWQKEAIWITGQTL